MLDRLCKGVGILLGLLLAWTGTAAPAQTNILETLPAAEVYRQACAACHGPDGRGYPGGEWRKRTALKVPPPDFTDPKFSSREPLADWITVIREGGPSRGLSSQMPAYGPVLSEHKIRELAMFIKTLGHDPRYPQGELNFLRALITAKAFPEDEFILIFRHDRLHTAEDGSYRVLPTVYYAHRFGPDGQFEIKATPEIEPGTTRTPWELELGLKWSLIHDLHRLWILTIGAETVIPIRSEDPVQIAPYVAVGKALGDRFTLQTSAHLMLSTRPTEAPSRVRFSAILHWLPTDSPRGLFPGLEVFLQRDLRAGRSFQVWLAPQLRITLTRRGHLALTVGPVWELTHTQEIRYRIHAFLLWEYVDGPFWEGW